MKLWVDDERQPPDDTWHWATTSYEALTCLQTLPVNAISLDHDLGGDDTTRPIVMWMASEEVWPKIVFVHTANPVGRDYLLGTCQRYAPVETQVSYRSRSEW